MKHSINLQIEVANAQERQAILQSIQIELQEQINTRGVMRITEENTLIKIQAEATDLVALRAMMNSALRLIKTITEVSQLLNE